MFRLIRVAILVSVAAAMALSSTSDKAVEKQTREGNLFSKARDEIKPVLNHPSAKAIKWAESLLVRMSLDQKIGQLVSIGVNGRFVNQDSDAYRELTRQVAENHIGGIVLYRGPVYESVHLVNRMQELARYPLLISADMEFGAGMRFDDTVSLPWNMAVGATGDPKYAQRQGEIVAREARALGVTQIFGPVADVNNNSDNPIINVRAYSEDPSVVATFSAAFIKGAQRNGVIATAKHFPGHGDTIIDSHRGLPVIYADRSRLNQIELPPFIATIKAGVASIMVAYIGLPKIDGTVIHPLSADKATRPAYVAEGQEIVTENPTLPAALSPTVVKSLLRSDLGFDGLVVTDALDMSGLTLYFGQDEAAVRAVEAGVDMLIKPSNPDAAVRGLRQAVLTGRITEKRIEESARRILAAKYDLGLAQRRVIPLDQIDHSLSNSEVVSFSNELAERALTLVRDDSKLITISLPPDAKIFNLAITNGDDRLVITTPFVEEMKRNNRQLDTIVLDERSSEEDISNAMKKAQDADLVIASLYGRVRAGEPLSAGLPKPSARALTRLIEQKIPIIGISFGNPYILRIFPQLTTYLVAYGDMPSLQRAAARALVGKTDITGRLPITLPGLYQRGTGIQLKSGFRQASLDFQYRAVAPGRYRSRY